MPEPSRPINLRSCPTKLHTADVLVIGFAFILSCINLVFSSRIPNWWVLVLINIGAMLGVYLLAAARQRSQSKLLRILHDWYVAPIVFLSFKELYFMIKPIHRGRDYDDVLTAIDQWIFGVNPTQWLAQYSHPVITEILQIAYTSFYFLFLILGYELWRRHKIGLFHYFMFTIVYGFFLSYLGYFFLPAVGPRFTLHDFAQIDVDLPGVLLTPYFRWFVNAGGSVPRGVPNDIAIAETQRDVFPSGHTMMTLVLIYLSAKLKARVRAFIYVIGSLLIVATVYQWYHYVIDLAAGAIFMLFCVRTSYPLYRTITNRLETIEKNFPEIEEEGGQVEPLSVKADRAY
jgi:membrane-associated phospholipid phosphatase